MMIRVMGLRTCSKCKTLKESLNYAKVEYSFSDCENHSDNCDSLEALTGTKHYPMVLISGLEEGILEVIYLTDSMNVLQEGVKMQNGVRLVPNHSLDGLYRYTLNRLNLKL